MKFIYAIVVVPADFETRVENMDIVNHGGLESVIILILYQIDIWRENLLPPHHPPPKKKNLRFRCKRNEILSLNLAENCEGLHLKDEDRTT